MIDLITPLRRAVSGRYAVERELGHGGMALVFLAQDLRHDRPVAIKVLRPELAQALGPERFLREIAIAARLTHPHILPLHDSGEADGLLYYVMPYIEGETLRDRLNRERQLPLEDALGIAREVADALAYAHAHQVVHRDIKPENILLEAGHAVVSDFGIARAVSEAGGEKLTETGVVLGTPAYMSPEQGVGEAVDGRSDIYALGVVLYEMLAGDPPFTGSTAQAILARKATEAVPSLQAIRESVSPSLDGVIRNALAKAPADRFTTVAEFAAALREASAETAVAAAPASARLPWIQISWAMAAGGVLVAAILTAVALARRPQADSLDPRLITVLPFRVAVASPAVADLAERMPDLFWMKITGDAGPRVSDPSTALLEWKRRGGSVAAGLPEDQAVKLAGKVGAARLVIGIVGGTDARMELQASLLEVPTGKALAREAVAGPLDSLTGIVDRLTLKLLGKEFGLTAADLPSLTNHPVAAVQAYLAGEAALRRDEWSESRDWQDRALTIDSSFALAAMRKYAAGEMHPEAARLAWAHRDQLSLRDRAFLVALAGREFGQTQSFADELAHGEAALRVAPDHLGSLSEYGEVMMQAGGLAGLPDWSRRARSTLERVIAIDSSLFGLTLLVELAIIEEDTAGLRGYTDLYLARVQQADVKERFEMRWLRALHLGDTAALAEVRARPKGRGPAPMVVGAAVAFGKGMEDAEWEAIGSRDRRGDHSLAMRVARSLGRYQWWKEEREGYYASLSPVVASAFRVRDALYLDGPADTALAAAVGRLEAIADGATAATPGARAVALCWRSQWRLARGDPRGVREAIRFLRTEVGEPIRFASCASLLDALLALSQGQDARNPLRRFDSVAASVPDPWHRWGVPYVETAYDTEVRRFDQDCLLYLDNLILIRLWLSAGDTTRALAAARRRPYTAYQAHLIDGFMVDFLREEGRLAAATGDTAGAIRAYQHYLRLRHSPDPPWRDEWDAVRARLAGLLGERQERP